MEEELNIQFIDIEQREVDARQKLRNDIDKLDARRKKLGGLGAGDVAEFERLKGLREALENNAKIDPLFAVVRWSFASDNGDVRPVKIDHRNGRIVLADGSAVAAGTGAISQLIRIALTLGFLQATGVPLPPIRGDEGSVWPIREHANFSGYSEAFFSAIGRVAGNFEIARAVLPILAEQGDLKHDNREPVVSTLEFATVVNKLIARGVKATDPHLRRYIDDTLDSVQDVDEDRPYHELGINLPNLETQAASYREDHVRLFAPVIFAAMFDELKAFHALDWLVEMSQQGEITVSRGKAGTQLYQYWRNAPNLMSEPERQHFYAMLLGNPSGAPGQPGNADFQDLWSRFVMTTCTLVRENRVDQLIRSSIPVAINQQQVKKAARDLVANMSSRGYGMAYYAAIDLQKQINQMIVLFSDPEIRAACGGSPNMWGSIEYIVQLRGG